MRKLMLTLVALVALSFTACGTGKQASCDEASNNFYGSQCVLLLNDSELSRGEFYHTCLSLQVDSGYRGDSCMKETQAVIDCWASTPYQECDKCNFQLGIASRACQ